MLRAFDGLCVADVCDGMDAAGLHNRGLMSPDIRPLWRDTEKFRHRFIGIAVTARYVPTQEPTAGIRSVDDYDRWASQWYNQMSSEPFGPLLRPGSALVIEVRRLAREKKSKVEPLPSADRKEWRQRSRSRAG